jgi:hypothetical protein
MENRCQIIDTTLREGEQAPGVAFTAEQKYRIIDGLTRVGVTARWNLALLRRWRIARNRW